MKDAIDLHVHASPSLFPRRMDAKQLLEHCRAAGMKGIVLKSHHGSTVEIAQLLAKEAGSFYVAGGLALNHFVGGLNPLAVESAGYLGAKVIWLPTIHAKQHEIACGCLGGFKFQGSPLKRAGVTTGLTLKEGDQLVPEMQEILDVLDGSGIVLATGHVGCNDISALIGEIAIRNLDIRVLVNHVFFHTPKLTVEQIEEVANDNVWFELSHLSLSSLTEAASIQEMVSAIRRPAGTQWVMVSDSGQRDNVASPEALSDFASQLRNCGISEEEIIKMAVSRPSELLDLY